MEVLMVLRGLLVLLRQAVALVRVLRLLVQRVLPLCRAVMPVLLRFRLVVLVLLLRFHLTHWLARTVWWQVVQSALGVLEPG